MTGLPNMQVRDSSIILFYTPGANSRRLAQENIVEARKKQYSGTVTAGVRKRMTRAVTLMSQATKPKWITNPVNGRLQYHRFSFITLTVACPRNLTAKQAYPMLAKPFCRWLHEVKAVKLYLWKAELQVRGQIHYHLIIPNFIHYEEIRKKWNSLQHQAGLLTEWAEKHGNFNPPSTEIKETRQVKNMTSYVAKELTKTMNAAKLKAKRMVESLVKAGEIPKERAKEFIEEYTGVIISKS